MSKIKNALPEDFGFASDYYGQVEAALTNNVSVLRDIAADLREWQPMV